VPEQPSLPAGVGKVDQLHRLAVFHRRRLAAADARRSRPSLHHDKDKHDDLVQALGFAATALLERSVGGGRMSVPMGDLPQVRLIGVGVPLDGLLMPCSQRRSHSGCS